MDFLNNITALQWVELVISIYMLISGILLIIGKKKSIGKRADEIYTEESIRKALPLIGLGYTIFGVFGLIYTIFSILGITGVAFTLVTAFMFGSLFFIFGLYFVLLKSKKENE